MFDTVLNTSLHCSATIDYFDPCVYRFVIYARCDAGAINDAEGSIVLKTSLMLENDIFTVVSNIWPLIKNVNSKFKLPDFYKARFKIGIRKLCHLKTKFMEPSISKW